jgi:hypothetical protein
MLFKKHRLYPSSSFFILHFYFLVVWRPFTKRLSPGLGQGILGFVPEAMMFVYGRVLVEGLRPEASEWSTEVLTRTWSDPR